MTSARFALAALATAIGAPAPAAPVHYFPTFGRAGAMISESPRRISSQSADQPPLLMREHLGAARLGAQPTRVVTIEPGLQWVNVAQDDVVRFVIGDRAFDWQFATHGLPVVDLASIAPAEFLPPWVELKVYVDPNPLHGGG